MKISPFLASFVATATVTMGLVAAPTAAADPVCTYQGQLNCVPMSAPTSNMESMATQNTATVSVPKHIETVVIDADAEWSAWFKAVGLREPMVSYNIILPGQTVTSQCTMPGQSGTMTIGSDFPNAFYCGVDPIVVNGVSDRGVLILPAEAFVKVWLGDVYGRQTKRAGDFAVAVIVAHEFGHSVVDELGTQRGVAQPTGKNKELIADCFSGAWASTAYKKGYLENGDIEEGVATFDAIGDTSASSDPHGTSAERVAAFTLGLNGQPFQCIAAYWLAFR